jgi:hypothetical protein
LDFARGIVDCEKEYQTLNEILRDLITFQQFVSIKNIIWRKYEVTHWVSITKENKAMDILDFARGIVDCEREYQTLNELLRDLITFQQFMSIKNPSWSKDEVTHWVGIAEENIAMEARWKEAQINPTPIRSKELCYSCKEPWEPDHRCRGKGKVHIFEVHYDSEDEEMYEDASIDAYLE